MQSSTDTGLSAPVLRRCQEMVSRLEWEPLLESILRTAILTAPAAGGALWIGSPDESPNASTGIRLHLVNGREGTPFPEAPAVLALSPEQLTDLGEKFSPYVDRLGALVPCGQAAQEQQALFLPLQSEGELYGLAALVPVDGQVFSEEHKSLLGMVGGFATVALGNARRVWTMEKSGFRERSTSVYFLNHFIDFAAKEIYKARRYHRTFCLAVVSIDRYEFLRTRFKEELREQYMRRWTECLTRVVRDADMVAKYSENEYFVLLPETDALGGRMFVRRMLESSGADPMFLDMDRNYRVSTLLGTAAYPADGRDYDELIAACRQSVERMRTSIYRRLELQDKSFWEMVELLLGWPEAFQDGGPEVSDFSRWALYQTGASAHGTFS